MKRKLVSIQEIKEILPIENADNIEWDYQRLFYRVFFIEKRNYEIGCENLEGINR